MPDDAAWDTYGEGGLVAELERRTAEVLGKEAAVFSISGKTAQLAALRVHADERGRTAIAAHPRSHIVEDENDAIGALWGLRVARTGSLGLPFGRSDINAVAEPLAAVVVELPLRRAAFAAPSWDELAGIADDARYRGAAVHLDGARLWECAPAYGRRPAEVAELADTVYVSYYKGLGGLAGGALAGDARTIAAARAWITRAGGIVYRMAPYAAAALAGLEAELPRMPAYYARAVALAARLQGIAGVTVAADPPMSNAFAVYVACDAATLSAAHDRVIASHGIEIFGRAVPAQNPAASFFEFVVGPATDACTDDEIITAFAALVAP